MSKRTGTTKPRAPRKPRAITINMQPFEAASRAAEISARAVLDGVVKPQIAHCTTWSLSYEAMTDFFEVKAGGVKVNVRYHFTFRYAAGIWELNVVARTKDSSVGEPSSADVKLTIKDVGEAIDVRSHLSAKDAAALVAAQMKHAREHMAEGDPDDVPF